MSSTKHTPGWEVKKNIYGGFDLTDGESIVGAFGERKARDMAATLNAMQGIDDPAAFRKCFEEMVKVCERVHERAAESAKAMPNHTTERFLAGDGGMTIDKSIAREVVAALAAVREEQ